MPTDQLWQKSAVELAQGIQQRTYSATEVLTSVFARVDAINPQLNALVEDHRESAFAQARQADNKSDNLAPLHGVPVSIKINADVRGHSNNNGIPAFKDIIAPDNAPIVQNLIDAGAIIVGMTNAPEFSMRGTTDNPLYGLTHNPWGEQLSPGGSSGGAGAAAAAGFGPIHHGNDIGGSLRFPATTCGVATVKPGFGRVPAFNPSATSERGMLAQMMSVQGIICRQTKDVALGMRSIIQHDPRDPWHVPMPFAGPQIDQPIKVAFTKNPHGYPIHQEIQNNLEHAAKLLANAGYVVEEVEPPPITEPAQGWLNVALLEIKLTLDQLARAHGSKTVQQVFDAYYTMSDMVDLEGYFSGIAQRTRMVREWSIFLAEYPLVLTPFLMQPTYTYDYDETYAGAKDLFDAAIYSFGLNYLGFPAGNIAAGFANNLPSGVQIVGQKFREDLILDAMQVIEDEVGVMAHHLWQQENQH